MNAPKNVSALRGRRKPLALRALLRPLRSARLLVVLMSLLLLGVSLPLFSAGAAQQSRRPTIDDRGGAQDTGISESARRQMEALIQEKESRTPAEQKIDSQLIYEMKRKRGGEFARAIQTIETAVAVSQDGMAVVDISAFIEGSLTEDVYSLGGEILSVFPQYHTLRARVPLDKLEALATLPQVRFIEPEQQAITSKGEISSTSLPQPLSREQRAANVRAALADALPKVASRKALAPFVGSRLSEGDATHRAALARAVFGVSGSGIRIGVLSDGVTNLAASQALGDLPAVTVLAGQAGSGDEGTAMLEIIHDLAPNAQLFFATAFGGIASFAQNIRDLRAAGCDIIVDDVFYFVETPFQDGQAPSVVSNTNGGVVIQAVNDVTAAGAMYFSSAGNSGNKNDNTSGVWEGDFVDGGASAAPLPAGSVHNFGGQNFNLLTAANTSAPISLYWSDPLGGSANDYDLFRLNAAGTAIAASSTNIQNGTQDPIEQISQSTANPRIVILKKAGAANRFLHLNANRGRFSINTNGQTHGHNSAANAFGCAATPAVGPFPSPFNAGNVVETFSSDGPRRLFYQPDGTPFTPGNVSSTGGLVRQKPDITAADGTTVTGVGGFPSPFFGTSAAAPHAAAIAALVKQAGPLLTPAQIRAALVSTAIDIEAAGVDRDSGAGIIMPFEALQAIGAVGQAYLEVGTTTATEAPGDGDTFVEPGEGATLSVQLKNTGVVNATNITTMLTTSTPGVMVTQPANSTYPDLAALIGTGTNDTLFRFTLASNAPCPLTINFTLTAVLTGGASPQILNFTVTVGKPPTVIATALDATAPPANPAYTAITGTQTGRVNRFAPVSVCGVAEANPGLAATTGTRRFDAYTFTACPDAAMHCVSVSLTNACTGTNPSMFVAAYSGSFNPASPATNWLADASVSNLVGNPTPFSFNVAGGSTFVIVVHEVNPGLAVGCNYTLSVSGCFPCETPNQLPVALCQDVTVAAGADCTATASIDNGSFDPEGGALTITQTPAGPYPLGTTSVLLTVADDKGATTQCTANVTVVDQTPPSISGASANPSELWPPNHQMVNVTVNYNTADNCSAAAAITCSLSVTSNEPVNGSGDGDTAPDWEVIDAHHVRLRSERAGTGSGRIYTITITCTDAAGNSSSQQVTVRVPKSRGK